MSEIQTRALALALFVGAPVLAWVVAIRLLWGFPPSPKGFYYAALGTTSQPYLLGALFVGVLFAGGAFKIIHRPSAFEGAVFRRFLRGTRIVDYDTLARSTLARRRFWLFGPRPAQVTLAQIPVPIAAETLHTLIVGGTGAGKSNLFNEHMLGALKRGDRFACIDRNGIALSKFWKPGDVILNPYDARSVGWSFFNEIRADYDFKRCSLSMVHAQTDDAEVWAGYGRLLLSETARKLFTLSATPSVDDLFRWTTIEPPDVLQAFLAGTLAESLFVGSSEASKAFGSARFILSDKLPEHVTMPKGDFSLRDWLDNPNGGNLWITVREDMAPALKPLISAWLDTLLSSILSMPETKRRLWLYIDELGALERLTSLEAALTMGRKNGLGVVAGIQSTAQLDDIYGRYGAVILRSCFSTLVALRISTADPTTAEDASLSLGEHEVERVRKSTTIGFNFNANAQILHERERVISPAQLTALPGLTGYIAIVGNRPIAKFKMPFQRYKERVPPFIQRAASTFGDAP